MTAFQYDTERAGDFSPLRFRRMDAAAKHIPLEQLGIGPQCGFSSGGGGGQPLTQDDTRRKLELIMNVAREVWGSA